MSLSCADAFLWKEEQLKGDPIYQSPVVSGGFVLANGNRIGAFFKYLQWKVEKKEGIWLREEVDAILTYHTNCGSFLIAKYFKSLVIVLGSEFFFESLCDFMEQYYEDFKTERYALVMDEYYTDIMFYGPWCRDVGGTFDLYINPYLFKPTKVSLTMSFSEGMKMVIDEIRESVNRELGREAVSLDGVIVDGSISLYTSLLSNRGYVFLENTEGD